MQQNRGTRAQEAFQHPSHPSQPSQSAGRSVVKQMGEKTGFRSSDLIVYTHRVAWAGFNCLHTRVAWAGFNCVHTQGGMGWI